MSNWCAPRRNRYPTAYAVPVGIAGLTSSVDVLAKDVLAQLAGPVDLVVGHSLGAIVALTVANRPGLWLTEVLRCAAEAAPD